MKREARRVNVGDTVLLGKHAWFVADIMESRSGDMAFLTSKGACFWSGRLDDKVEVHERA